MRFKTSKMNEFRTWGLVFILAGMACMILGTGAVVFQFPGKDIFLWVGLILGLLLMFASMCVYFWAGMLSTSARQIQCPECGGMTKMLGKTDRCNHCRTILTLDPSKATEMP